MRQIYHHESGAADKHQEVVYVGDLDADGVSSEYRIGAYGESPENCYRISFRASQAAGAGVSEATLLAILVDRLQCMQDGPQLSQARGAALQFVKDALHEIKMDQATRRTQEADNGEE